MGVEEIASSWIACENDVRNYFRKLANGQDVEDLVSVVKVQFFENGGRLPFLRGVLREFYQVEKKYLDLEDFKRYEQQSSCESEDQGFSYSIRKLKKFRSSLSLKERNVFDAMLRKAKFSDISALSGVSNAAITKQQKTIIAKLADYLNVDVERVQQAFKQLHYSHHSSQTYQPLLPAA